ncbi:hypothetical protein A2943_00715 [Candidatus Adlerbacteria bacterium RIFCSPLOWO2_01_FULL_51_16]|uniref:DUF475 domain-containing protein n=1 Tax=Candidatus Adlerbacteria bacterium RIFCSPLOWO2_01_FULL_51_16 TaxID=1797243 RepID=A0A1F4XHR7_9BACT|nr:MAG: hypothetical protein A2943_00715 [Candidatus Adlerbacteria bacterium RIFCSPLOWO2_01_FULL_51_16]
MRLFIAPALISLSALVAIFFWGGWPAFLLVALLSLLEVTLSFDNAVVNAKVLAQMSPAWQRRFLTWGILIAVFGTRLILPAIIVGLAAWISPLAAAELALNDPEAYGRLMENVAPAISAFGGVFLLMVALKYFFDVSKHVHWIAWIERHLVRWGRVEAIELALALATLLGLSYLAENQATVLSAGSIGLLTFVIMQGITSTLDVKAGTIVSSGAVLFIYLNILDSAFSLDGVVGAFALTTAIPIIFVGLGIGAYFVRSITVYLVRKKTLNALRYLEHGAHWAIFGLGLSMLTGIVVHVPEILTGLIGLVFVSLAYVSSRRAIRS